MKFNSIEQAIADIKLGKVVIVVDDESRENEGDFVAANEALQEIDTQKQTTCTAVADLLNIPLQRTDKLIALMANGALNILLLRGDHTLNETKVSKISDMAGFHFASEEEVRDFFNCPPGFIGPVGINRTQVRLIADHTVATMSDFVVGANKPKLHLAGVNWGRDFPEPDLIADIRNVISGDVSPDGKGSLEICRGIEVGHIFQLGTKYAKALDASYLDSDGKLKVLEMGSYGIGISRIVAAAIEQNHDERGITIPTAIAPFQVVIAPIGKNKSEAVHNAAEQLYSELTAANIDVLLDDRDKRPGVMFADMELIGIPHRIVIGDRGLKEGMVEYQGRRDAQAESVSLQNVVDFLQSKLCD